MIRFGTITRARNAGYLLASYDNQRGVEDWFAFAEESARYIRMHEHQLVGQDAKADVIQSGPWSIAILVAVRTLGSDDNSYKEI